MSDYIKRTDAIDAVCGWGPNDLTEAIRADIETIPTADVRPVVRGKWSKELHPSVKYNQFRCSVCGKFSGHDEEGWIWKPNYCPNCGADMREES